MSLKPVLILANRLSLASGTGAIVAVCGLLVDGGGGGGPPLLPVGGGGGGGAGPPNN